MTLLFYSTQEVSRETLELIHLNIQHLTSGGEVILSNVSVLSWGNVDFSLKQIVTWYSSSVGKIIYMPLCIA